MSDTGTFDFDVVLSFAGNDRAIADELARCLGATGVRVFFDANERASLWGKDLYQHLQSVYRDRARYCVIFVSESYAKCLWTSHELKQAQARAFRESAEYILPVRVDGTELPGLNPTTGYIDLRETDIHSVCQLLLEKLGLGLGLVPSEPSPEDDQPELLDLRVEVDDSFRACMEALASLSNVGLGEKDAVVDWGLRVQALTTSGSRDARQMQKLVNERAEAFRRQRVAMKPLVERYREQTTRFFESLGAMVDYQIDNGMSAREEMLDGVLKFSAADKGAIGLADTWEQVATSAESLHVLTKDFRKERNAFVATVRELVSATNEWLSHSRELRLHLGASE